MGVYISNEELNTFKQNGISEDAIRYTINAYREEGVSDEEIRSKIDVKLNSFKPKKQTIKPSQKQIQKTQPKKQNAQPVNQPQPKQQEQPQFKLTGGIKQDVTLDPIATQYENVVNNPNLTKEQKLSEIDKIKTDIDKQANIQNVKEQVKKYLGAGLEIASGFLPVGVGGRIGATAVKALAPKIGQLTARGLVGGTVGGLTGGALYGVGEGLLEDENIAKTAAKEALIGAGLGGALGATGGKIIDTINRNQRLKNIELRKLERATRSDVKPSDYGVADINSELNQSIANQIENNIRAEEELLSEYKTVRSDLVKKYGSVEKLKEQAVKDLPQETEYGQISDALNDYRNLIAYEQELGNARYISTNIKPSSTREGKIVQNLATGKLTGKSQGAKAVKQAQQIEQIAPLEQIEQTTQQNINKPFNIIGEEIPQQSRPQAKQIKQSQLAQNADLPPEMRQAINENPPEYQVLHNDELMQQAQENISKDFSSSKARLQSLASSDRKTAMTDLDFEEARQVISQLYKEGNIDEANELIKQVSQKATEAGRAVQALSLWSKTTPEGAVRQAQKLIDNYNKTAKKKIPQLSQKQTEEIQALSDNIQKATTDEEREIATALLLKYQAELLPAKAMDKVKTLRNISLLLNLKTFGRNVVGNALLSGLEQPTKALASGIDTLMSLKTGEKTRVAPQLKEYIQGIGQGLKKGVRDVKLGINTRDSIGKRYDLPPRRSFTAMGLRQLEDALNYSLQVPDRAFYEATFAESLANQMKAKGVEKATGEMVQQATNEALEAVFQNDTVLSDLTLMGRRALNKINIGGFGLGDLKIPYAQTPANVVQMGINYSPLGLAKGLYTASKGNQRQASLDLARGIVGSGIYGAGLLGVNALGNNDSENLITEPIEDYQIRKNYETLGIRPNQINIGDTGYSYAQLQPLALPLTAGAATGSQKEPNLTNIANAGLSQLADLPMLKGVSEIVDDVRYGGWGDALINLPAGLPSQFVPTLLNQINAYADPYQRETYDPNTLMRGLNQAISKVPLASNLLPYKYDVRGQKVKKYESEKAQKAFDVFLNPSFANKRKDDPVMQELLGIYERTGSKTQLLQVADRKVTYKDEKGKKVEKKLTGKELSEYQRQLGQVTYKTMEQIMNTPFYQNLDDENKTNLLSNIKKNSKQVVDENFLGKPENKRVRMLRKLYKTDRQKAIEELMREVKKITPILSEKYYNETIGE